MLFNKPLTEINENDLQTLIDNQVPEGKTIEYKRDLPGSNYKERKEFLADVSSFANTIGGYLIYGIDAKHGIPIELCGVKLASVDDLRLTCENRLREGLFPQIPPVDIQPIELQPNNYIIVLRIPRSWLAPHRVTLENHGHFYGRNSAGHFQMDVPQMREAFILSETTAERMRSFRAERLNRIESGEEIPAPLTEQAPKLVLHMLPLNAFSTPVSTNIRPLYDGIRGELLNPLIAWDLRPDVDMRFNVDGITRSVSWGDPPSTAAYTQVFRNGIIETVDMSILGVNTRNADKFGIQVEKRSFGGVLYEKQLLETVKRYINLQQFLGVDPPFFIMVSFLGVKGYRISHPTFKYNPSPYTREIDRTNLIISEVMLDSFDADVATVMRPVFDTVWNAAGFICSPNYDSAGKFTTG